MKKVLFQIILSLFIASHLWAANAATDNFNRADGVLETGNWSSAFSTPRTLCIVSSRVQDCPTNGQDSAYYNANTPGNSQFSQFKIITMTGASYIYFIATTNVTTGTNPNRYKFFAIRNDIFFGGQTSYISVVVSGVETTLAQESATTWAANDVLRGQVDWNGSSNTLTLLRNGTPVLTVSGDNSLSPGGHGGIEMFTGESTLSNAQIGNWCGGTVGDSCVSGTGAQFFSGVIQ